MEFGTWPRSGDSVLGYWVVGCRFEFQPFWFSLKFQWIKLIGAIAHHKNRNYCPWFARTPPHRACAETYTTWVSNHYAKKYALFLIFVFNLIYTFRRKLIFINIICLLETISEVSKILQMLKKKFITYVQNYLDWAPKLIARKKKKL